jgi:predicted nucleic acid-binding protein
MSDKCFVDMNILIYAHDRSAGRKHQRAQRLIGEIWDAGNGIFSTQVLPELCVSLRRKAAQPLPLEELHRLLQDYLSWELVVNTPEAATEALDLEARYRISFWDALILQAAETAGATVLYSEDLSAGQKFGSLRVVNPLTE